MRGVRESEQIDAGGRTWFREQAAAATDGDGAAAPGEQVAMVERTALAGQMAPLHRRDEHETYRVLDGEVTFFVGPDVVEAASGEVVVAPAGAARTFRVKSERARWLVLTTVSSLERFNDFARAVSSAGRTGARFSPEEQQALAAIGKPNRIELLGPPGALPDRDRDCG
jgi:quercetin dioxygenase-like cupin family protein